METDKTGKQENKANEQGLSQGTRESTEISEWMEKLNEAQKEAEKQRNDYFRAVADLENYRKRVVKEKEEVRMGARTDILEGLLPIVDNLALGLEAASRHKADTVGTVLRGFEMILVQMQALLKDNGVELVEPKRGERFDPKIHEGVAHVVDEEIAEEGITEVIRPGYKVAGRLLRPASVVVSSGKHREEGDGEERIDSI